MVPTSRWSGGYVKEIVTFFPDLGFPRTTLAFFGKGQARIPCNKGKRGQSCYYIMGHSDSKVINRRNKTINIIIRH